MIVTTMSSLVCGGRRVDADADTDGCSGRKFAEKR